MKEEITAEWARRTAQTILSEKVNKELSLCFIAIEHAVKNNELCCNVYFVPEDLTMEELTKRDFKLICVPSTQRDEGFLEIKW